MTGKVLILPGGVPRSLAFLEQCRNLKQEVVGASSVHGDPAANFFKSWAFLPNVTEPAFEERLKDLIVKEGIDRLYTPHFVIWQLLSQRLAHIAPDIHLLGPAPLEVEMAPYRHSAKLADDYRPYTIAAVGRERSGLSHIQRLALWRHVEVIPGMCDHLKTCALLSVSSWVPEGDLVEIGSWWGKSAAALAILRQFHQLGTLLCVDPWASENLVQQDSPGIVNATSLTADTEEAFKVFQMNLLPYAQNGVGYLRMPSKMAANRYRAGTLTSEEFGAVELKGKIALLHIDGNHDYDAVQTDIHAWTPHLSSNGWIIFDDYVWPFGDGPRRAADEYIQKHAATVRCAFLAGSALFVQFD